MFPKSPRDQGSSGVLSAMARQRSYCLLLPAGGREIYAEDAPVGSKEEGGYPIMLPKIVGLDRKE